MKDKKMEYLDKEYNTLRIVRAELLLMPLLIIMPILVSILFIQEWFYRGYSLGISDFNGQLILGIIILISNITFGIPFIKALIKFRKR